MRKIAGVLGLLFLGGLVAMRLWFVGVHIIPQNGMYPTIPKQSVILSWKRPYRSVAEVGRGDVVVFEQFEGGRRYLYVWRVVGIPGDKVEASGDQLVLNGSPLERVPLREEGAFGIFRERSGTLSYEVAIEKHPKHVPPDVSVALGPDELFVMGDNRYDARDSRYTGAITFGAIIGRKL